MSKDTDALNLILHIHRIFDQTKLRIEQGLFDTKKRDLYNYVASIAFDVDEDQVSPPRRSFVKTCLFGAQFGASPQTIADATRKHKVG